MLSVICYDSVIIWLAMLPLTLCSFFLPQCVRGYIQKTCCATCLWMPWPMRRHVGVSICKSTCHALESTDSLPLNSCLHCFGHCGEVFMKLRVFRNARTTVLQIRPVHDRNNYKSLGAPSEFQWDSPVDILQLHSVLYELNHLVRSTKE